MKKLCIIMQLTSFLVSHAAAEKDIAEENVNQLTQCMLRAITERDLPKIEQLLDAGASPNQCVNSYRHCVKQLYNSDNHERCYTTTSTSYPLHRALNGEDPKSLEVVKLLVKKGANLEVVWLGKSILECAISGYSRIRKMMLLVFLENGIPIDFDRVRKCLREREEPFAPESSIGQTMRMHNGIVGSVIREQVNIGAKRKKLLPSKIEEFLPDPKLIQLVGEYAYPYYDYQELE
jgi:hypothetical protein